jgi:hypothetical protein
VQLLVEPALLRGGGPRDAGARWARLLAHNPFEHIYRHHRRYRFTEGAEETEMRRIAGYMFGFMKQRAPKGGGGKGMIARGRPAGRLSISGPLVRPISGGERR